MLESLHKFGLKINLLPRKNGIIQVGENFVNLATYKVVDKLSIVESPIIITNLARLSKNSDFWVTLAGMEVSYNTWLSTLFSFSA